MISTLNGISIGCNVFAATTSWGQWGPFVPPGTNPRALVMSGISHVGVQADESSMLQLQNVVSITGTSHVGSYGMFAWDSSQIDTKQCVISDFDVDASSNGFLPSCSSRVAGAMRAVDDSKANRWGAAVSGAGRNEVLAYCNGTAWTVAAK